MKKVIKTAAWTRAEALKVHADDPTTTQPPVPLDFPVMNEQLAFWDTWALRDISGKAVSYNGWNIIFQLTAPLQHNDNPNIVNDWVNRHGHARISYSYSRDGKSWQYGGYVFAEGASPTTREWAGCTLLTKNNSIEMYYTAVTPGATIIKTLGQIHADDSGVWFSGFDEFLPLLEADGVIYQTEEQNPGWGFRDPWVFEDPHSGKTFMLFEGNVAGYRGTHDVGEREKGFLPPGYDDVGNARFQTGCIGIAECTDKDRNKWKMLPPLITAVGVNDQTERPHLVFKDNRYYLFTISHAYTYAEGLQGPDGVYGFVSDSLLKGYEPLNGSGLVLGNPSAQPFQTYSHYVSQDGLVQSFIDSIPVPDSDDFRIGGTLAPTVRIVLENHNTYLVEELDYGYIPAQIHRVFRERNS